MVLQLPQFSRQSQFYIMNGQLILRVRSQEGQYRINIKSKDTYRELLLQLAKKLNMPIKDIIVARQDNKVIVVPQSAKIGDVGYLTDGTVLNITSRNPKNQALHSGIKASDIQYNNMTSRCNHPPGGKCLNCISNSQENTNQAQKMDIETSKCHHGPNGRCLNCTSVNLKDKENLTKMLCQHGPNAKCVHCLDKQYISDTSHISFDNWLQQRKLKCKGVHPLEVKCNNCLPPSKVRYQVDRTCKQHQPYPKAMCNKCIPPNVVIKRQEYRHVDYVQFMNIGQIQDFVRYWLPRKNQQQRVGYLYGYYAEDPYYKGGIRVIVEALYEPKQSGTFGDFQILQKEEDPCLNAVVTGLTLQRVGWIYTDTNHDVVMSAKHVRMAAKFQEQYRVPHGSGYEVSNFITVILRTDEKNPNEVKPEVYMISDQGQALQHADMFVDSVSRRKMQVRVKQSSNDAIPSFICGGKTVTQFEPEFLLVKIAHGSSANNKFAIIKKAEFPPFVRDKPSKKELKEYLRGNKNIKQSWLKYSDFNLLIYLAHEIDPHTVHSIAQCVSNEQNVQQFIDQMIQNKSDLWVVFTSYQIYPFSLCFLVIIKIQKRLRQIRKKQLGRQLILANTY